MARVVVTQRFFDEASKALLEAAGCTVVEAELPPGEADGNLSHDQLLAMVGGAEGWIVGHARVTRKLLEALPDLRVISRRGVGYERVDLAAATELGKVVTIAVGGNDASVADHTIGMMLALAKRLGESKAAMERGDWSILMGRDLFEATVGVVGLGRIGRSVVKRLQGFDATILAVDHLAAAAGEMPGVTFVELPELLARSDYVTLHAPLTDGTRALINADTLAQMKPSAFLINAARGGLVDDDALLDALRDGVIAGAGLDTFLSEADPAKRPTSDALLALPNVVATPHAAASSLEGLNRTNMVASRCVIDVLAGRTPPTQCVVADGRGG